MFNEFSSDPTKLSPQEIVIIQMINTILSCISIFASFFVFLIYGFIKEIRTFALELVIWLCIANSMSNISFFINWNYEGDDNSLCKAQGFIQLTFDNSAMIWGSIIGYTAYRTVINYDEVQSIKNKLRIYYLIIGYVLPLIPSFIVLYFKGFGKSGAWCWLKIEDKSENKIIFVIISYGCMWIFIILNLYFIIKVILTLKSNQKSEEEKILVDKIIKKLRLYPIIMIICIVPATINRLYNLSNNQEIAILFYIQTFFDSLQGLLFAIIFGIDSSIKEVIKQFCSTLFKNKSSTYTTEKSNESESRNYNNFESFISIEDFTVKNNLKKSPNNDYQ